MSSKATKSPEVSRLKQLRGILPFSKTQTRETVTDISNPTEIEYPKRLPTNLHGPGAAAQFLDNDRIPQGAPSLGVPFYMPASQYPGSDPTRAAGASPGNEQSWWLDSKSAPESIELPDDLTHSFGPPEARQYTRELSAEETARPRPNSSAPRLPPLSELSDGTAPKSPVEAPPGTPRFPTTSPAMSRNLQLVGPQERPSEAVIAAQTAAAMYGRTGGAASAAPPRTPMTPFQPQPEPPLQAAAPSLALSRISGGQYLDVGGEDNQSQTLPDSANGDGPENHETQSVDATSAMEEAASFSTTSKQSSSSKLKKYLPSKRQSVAVPTEPGSYENKVKVYVKRKKIPVESYGDPLQDLFKWIDTELSRRDEQSAKLKQRVDQAEAYANRFLVQQHVIKSARPNPVPFMVDWFASEMSKKNSTTLKYDAAAKTILDQLQIQDQSPRTSTATLLSVLPETLAAVKKDLEDWRQLSQWANGRAADILRKFNASSGNLPVLKFFFDWVPNEIDARTSRILEFKAENDHTAQEAQILLTDYGSPLPHTAVFSWVRSELNHRDQELQKSRERAQKAEADLASREDSHRKLQKRYSAAQDAQNKLNQCEREMQQLQAEMQSLKAELDHTKREASGWETKFQQEAVHSAGLATEKQEILESIPGLVEDGRKELKKEIRDLEKMMTSSSASGRYVAIPDQEFRSAFEALALRINKQHMHAERPAGFQADANLDPTGYLARWSGRDNKSWPNFVRSVCWRVVVGGFFQHSQGLGALGGDGTQGQAELFRLYEIFMKPQKGATSTPDLPASKDFNMWRSILFAGILSQVNISANGTDARQDQHQQQQYYADLFHDNVARVQAELTRSLNSISARRLDARAENELALLTREFGLLALRMGSQRAHVRLETAEAGGPEAIVPGKLFACEGTGDGSGGGGGRPVLVDLMTQPCLMRVGDGRENLVTSQVIARGQVVAVRP